MMTEETPMASDLRELPPPVAFAWREFVAGLMNWYLFGKVIWVLKNETRYLARSTSGYVNCGTCFTESSSEVFVWCPIYLVIGVILWKRVLSAAPGWRHWVMWPVRFAIVIWCGVFGTLILLPLIPFWK